LKRGDFFIDDRTGTGVLANFLMAEASWGTIENAVKERKDPLSLRIEDAG